MKHLVIPRCFWQRATICGAASLVVVFLVGALFGGASGADFEPVVPGHLFATYHTALAALLTVLMLPGMMLHALLSAFGLEAAGSDALYLAIIFLGHGLLVALLWKLISHFVHAGLQQPMHTKRSNQAMQLTTSKPDVHAWGVCRRASTLRAMHGGLAAADLVAR